MDVVRGIPVRHRVPDATLSLTGVIPARGGDYVERPMPVASAVFWTPIGQPGADPTYPIMITRAALAAVHAQLAARSEGAASVGFLVGGLYLSPETRIPYIIVESTIDMPWSIGGDHLKSALLQGRDIALQELQPGEQLLGWYHCHTALRARLSAPDVEAHLACFEEPWHVALVVARGLDVTGGVFRTGLDGTRSNEYLPFYELPEPAGRGANSDTGLPWANYRPQALALSLEGVAQPAGAPPPRVFLPEDAEIDDAEVEAKALPARPLARLASPWVLALAAAGVLFGAYRALASGRGGGGGAAAVEGNAVTPDRVQRLADSTAFAVAAFGIRARLFDGRKMACADLGRGLVEVEDRWTAYSAARGVAGGAGTLDAAQVVRDRRLHADVNAVEDRFASTGCPRP
jgi:hypothetical protein